MRVPQEVVDAIIDNFAMSDDEKIWQSHWPELDDANSLRACSLTSRSFLRRSRMHLFAATFCHSLSEFSHFDRLLAESPHIGELYVRHFTLSIRDRRAPFVAEDVVLPRILSRLPRLTHLTLDFLPTSHVSRDNIWMLQPPQFKTSIQATLSLHYLRSLRLYDLKFTNVSEFESLLSHAPSLKALTLGRIAFENPSIRRVDLPHDVCVVLESLELELELDAVDAIVSSFSIVDINHLQSLNVTSTHMIPLLKANAETIQKVQIFFPHYLKETADPDTLKALRSIEITGHSFTMVSALQQFGDLGHLKALRTVTLRFADRSSLDRIHGIDWPKLDAILAQAVDGLEDIHIRILTSSEHPPDEGLISSMLPSVRGNIAAPGSQKMPS
ncbi:hypothetical protein C8J57DRAFT_1469885 [Mycena rebaudengoi]|nr:hypothetical protein C8J57DRAFT_1469885 [Mycena rebaudengoi]